MTTPDAMPPCVLRVPQLPKTFVHRAELNERLDHAAEGGVTVLVAPVGAGKTLGVSGWLTTRGLAQGARWISAHAHWTPARLRQVLDDVAAEAGAARPVVVVDDAHELPYATLRAIDERLLHSPEGLRLLLLTQWDLPLSRLIPELHGDLTVLRGDVLRLDEEETATLVRTLTRTDDPAVTHAVAAQARGWCAAVVLTARAIAASREPDATARTASKGEISIADRLASEVFSGLRPQERHLLLCVAAERTVDVELATHLSHDSGAGDVLSGLETTGLLVTRVPREQAAVDDALDELGAVYRIHPLLAEAVRRRLAAGGVDVLRAQATVRRAVGLDLARGDSRRGFARLVALDLPHEAAAYVAEADQGLLLLARDRAHRPGLASFARRHPDAVADLPAMWLAIGVEHFLANETSAAAHWLRRVADLRPAAGESPHEVRIAYARLVLARAGMAPLEAAVEQGERILQLHATSSTPRVLIALLMMELGVCHNLRGDLLDAQERLAAAAMLARSVLLPAVAAMALSHLALTAYMLGREHVSAEIARQTLSLLPPSTGGHPGDSVRRRAELALELATMSDLPTPSEARPRGESPAEVADSADSLTGFWAWLRDARAALVAGSVIAARQHVEMSPPVGMALPRQLRVVVLVERACLASLAGDQRSLRGLQHELRQLALPGESALVRGLWHELQGDRKAACAAYATATDEARYPQPASRPLALCCRAQLLDVLGEPEEALACLAEAATLTEVRRNAAPFLGWSRLGTPIEGLLRRLATSSSSRWVHELAEGYAGRPDVAEIFAPSTAYAEELASQSEAGPTTVPTLSAREREVLHELARGATYADIAGHLFVSENTVKTHVSNLYGKLVVTRRSEALAVARAFSLI